MPEMNHQTVESALAVVRRQCEGVDAPNSTESYKLYCRLRTAAQTLAAEIERLTKERGWRPIDDGAMDGTQILLADSLEESASIVVGQWIAFSDEIQPVPAEWFTLDGQYPLGAFKYYKRFTPPAPEGR